MAGKLVRDYINGSWVDSTATERQPVHNPATGEVLGETPLGGARDVDRAVQAAAAAFPAWRATPVVERARFLFRLRELLEAQFEDLARSVTHEQGKTLDEARGSVRRGIECVEVACGAPTLMMGRVLEDIAPGIDCQEIRQPLGVFACIAPFNFPMMVPLWFYPFAVACGNTYVCKPSEQVPFSQQLVFELIHQAGFPPGVLNLVNGGHEAANAILEHEGVIGVSFVGSTPVAEHVYRLGTAHGKRVQALGGAKNFLVVMPDAVMAGALDAITNSAYGCAGERCLAGTVVLTVGDCHAQVREGLIERIARLRMGDGMSPGVTLGPVISARHRERVLEAIARGVAEGAELVVDGRSTRPEGQTTTATGTAGAPGAPTETGARAAGTRAASDSGAEGGYFVGACLFDRVTPEMSIAREEIFGPVLALMNVASLDEALRVMKAHPLANATAIFTTSGRHAREFQYHAQPSMLGVNVGVPAPMSFFSFGGAKASLFGDLKAHGREAFDFFTDRKVVISRWG